MMDDGYIKKIKIKIAYLSFFFLQIIMNQEQTKKIPEKDCICCVENILGKPQGPCSTPFWWHLPS